LGDIVESFDIDELWDTIRLSEHAKTDNSSLIIRLSKHTFSLSTVFIIVTAYSVHSKTKVNYSNKKFNGVMHTHKSL